MELHVREVYVYSVFYVIGNAISYYNEYYIIKMENIIIYRKNIKKAGEI
jgi:hypothetical protein